MSESTLEVWRADPAAFAEGACGQRSLVLWQREELRAAVRPGWLSAWLWARQSGKSLMFALLALWVAITRPGSRVMLLSGGGDAGGRRVIEAASRMLAGSNVLRSSVVDETASIIRFDNGSEIRSVAASEMAIRGWTVDALLIDEAQLLSDELIFGAAMPTTITRDQAFIVMAGTAGRAEGGFFDTVRRGETGVEGIRASRRRSKLLDGDDEMPWQNPTVVERIVTAIGPTRADAEFRNIFATGSGYMFGLSDLNPLLSDYVPDTLETMRGPVGVRAGLDLAVASGGDHTALVALAGMAVPGVERRMFAVRCAHQWESGTPLVSAEGEPPGVFEQVARSPAVLDSLRVDASGLGAGFVPIVTTAMRRRDLALGGGQPASRMVLVTEDAYADEKPRRVRFKSDELRAKPSPTSVKGVVFTSAMKQAVYGALRMLVQRRQLLLPASAIELRRQLLALKTGLTASGSESFEAESGAHDDLPDALALALTPYKGNDGRWRTVVGALADRPAYPAGPASSDWATTSSGLRVPRRPAWRDLRTTATTYADPTGPQPIRRGPDPASLNRTMSVLDALATTETRGR